jgi:hypothetical protein
LASSLIKAAEVVGKPTGVSFSAHLDKGFDGGDDVLPKPVAGGEPLIQEPPIQKVGDPSRDDDHPPGRGKVGAVGFSHRDGSWRTTHAHATRSGKSMTYTNPH